MKIPEQKLTSEKLQKLLDKTGLKLSALCEKADLNHTTIRGRLFRHGKLTLEESLKLEKALTEIALHIKTAIS